MAQATDDRILYGTQSATVDSAAPNGAAHSPDIHIAVLPDNKNVVSGELIAASTCPPYFHEALKDAERLLKYAAEAGIEIEAETRDHILQARATAGGIGWNEETVANLLAALTKLALVLKPVTAESLKACNDDTTPTIHTYWIVAFWLAVLIVPFSLASFISSAISNAIRADITTANDLAVKLRAELGTSAAPSGGTPEKPLPKGLNEADVISQLQLYASTIRAIDARSLQLNWFVFQAARDPFAEYRWNSKASQKEAQGLLIKHPQQKLKEASTNKLNEQDQQKLNEEDQRELNEKNQETLKAKFQLEVGLPNMPKALDTLTTTYQDVRLFGQDVLDLISVYYGAITTCLLPVLYALLGTCAYLLRTFEQQMAARTFIPSSVNSARFLIAAIGGAVVGLFNNFTITQAASIPPLAIAFLVGYAVEVFFSFLEGLLQVFTKNKSGPSSPQPVRSSH